MQNPETTMGFPEGTITYDDVVLAGDMSLEQVAACIGAGAKSWVYLNDVSHAACPKAAVEGASLPFECIPLTSPNDLTPALVDTFIAALDAAPKPLVIQCSTATRSGISLIPPERLGAEQARRRLRHPSRRDHEPLQVHRPPRTARRRHKGPQAQEAHHLPPALRHLRLVHVHPLIADGPGGDAVLIDPVLEMVDRDLKLIDDLGVNLKYAVNTHCHADHVTGSGLIKSKRPGVKSVIAEASGAVADVKVRPGDRVAFGDLHLEVRATPGHTAGCLSHVFDDMVFTGDALLIRGCGRTDFQGGRRRRCTIRCTLRFTLPDDTVVYPAHDYKGHRTAPWGRRSG